MGITVKIHRMDGTTEIAELGVKEFFVGDQIIRKDGIAPEVVVKVDGDKITAKGVCGERIHDIADIRAW